MYVYSEFSLLIRLEKSSCWLLRECFHLQELISEHLLLPPRHSGTFKPNSFQISKCYTAFGLHYSSIPKNGLKNVCESEKLMRCYDQFEQT